MGRTTCSECGASLAAARLAGGSSPRTWRRSGDRVAGKPLAWAVAIALVVGIGASLFVRQVFRGGPEAVPALEPLGLEGLTEKEPAPSVVTPVAPLEVPQPVDRGAFDRGRKLLAAGEIRASLGPLTQAASDLPSDPLVSHTYGQALWRAGSRDRALFQFEKAVRLAPDVASYHVELALALGVAGRRDRAVQEYQIAYQLDPANAAAAEALSRVPGAAPVPVVAGAFAPPDGPAAPPGTGGAVDLGGASRRPSDIPVSSRRAFTDEDLRRYRAAAPGTPAAPPPATAASAVVPPSGTPPPQQ